MTNLKKVLSLVLVFAMALGLMITGSAATWSDTDDITNYEDAALLNSLQIMQGNADGSFDPDGILTRAQIAKMIYVARTGGVDDKAILFKGASNLFTDVAGHWAQGYINYAAAKGFVSGRGNGIFDPDAKVTGYELLKIALTALGYNSDKQGFTGANWKMNVAAAAIDAGLITGYTADPSLPITRDDAANIFANMIYASTVGYDIYGVLGATAKTFGTAYLNLTAVEGVVLENDGGIVNSESAMAAANAGKTKLQVVTVNGTTPPAALTGSLYFTVATDADALGQTVTLYIKGTNAAAVYGSAVISSKNTVVTTAAGMGAAANDTTAYSLRKFAKDSGVQLDAATVAIALDATDGGADLGALGAGLATYANGNGQSLKLIDNDGDSIAEYAIKTIKSVDTILNINAKKTATGVAYNEYVGLASGATLTSLNTVGTVAKYDTVLYSLQNGKYNVSVAKSITGKATTASAVSLTVAGNVLMQSALNSGALINAQTLAQLGTNVTAGEYNPYTNSFTYFVDDGGYVIKITKDMSVITNTYAVLIDAAYVAGSGVSGTSYTEAKLLFTDGTTQIVKIYSITDDASPAVTTTNFSTAGGAAVLTAAKGKIFAYSVRSTDDKYVLTEASATNATTTIAKGASLIAGAANYYGTASTIYLVQNTIIPGVYYTYTAYTGYANIPAVASQTVEVMPVSATSPVASIVYIAGGVTSTQSSYNAYVVGTSANYVYVENGTSYYTKDAIINGEKTVLKFADLASANFVGTGWFKFKNGAAPTGTDSTISGDYIITQAAAITAEAASAVSYVGNNTLVLASGGYTYSDSTAVWLIDSITKAVTVTTIDAIVVGDNVNVVTNPLVPTAVTTVIVMK